VQDEQGRPYYDTPKPPRFTTVESFDGQIFSRIDEHAQSLLSGAPDARYSPVEVAWRAASRPVPGAGRRSRQSALRRHTAQSGRLR